MNSKQPETNAGTDEVNVVATSSSLNEDEFNPTCVSTCLEAVSTIVDFRESFYDFQ